MLDAVDNILLTARVAFPRLWQEHEPPDEPGGPPKSLQQVSRLPVHQVGVIDGVAVLVRPDEVNDSEGWPAGHDRCLIRLLLPSDSFVHALDVGRSLVEDVVDAMSFQMQHALHVVSLDLMDVSAPLIDGEYRAVEIHGHADARVAPKFSIPPADFSWSLTFMTAPLLERGPFAEERRVRTALWWYVKSLDAPYLVDKFICLWTALEVLWALSDVSVSAPYTATCGHQITECPHCGQSVSREVRGASLKQFMTQHGGVSVTQAKKLWQTRQVVHGHDVFSPSGLDELFELVPALRAAVLTMLKGNLGLPLEQPPAFSRADGPSFTTVLILEGDRIVSRDHLDDVTALALVGPRP